MATLVNLIRNSLTQTDGTSAESCWSPKGMANSTSFSDFSLGTAMEVESVMTETPEGSPTASEASSQAHSHFFSRRFSCDYPSLPPRQQPEGLRLFRSSMDSRSLLWGQQNEQTGGSADVRRGSVRAEHSAGPPSPSTPRASCVPPAAPRTPPKPIDKQRKIDGMDYYEYVELIRSSSL